MVSSFKDCTWNLVYLDDADQAGETLTVIDTFRTGAGQYSFKILLEDYRLDTSSGTGIQRIAIDVLQRAGSGSDFSASIGVKERDA
jgi:hypothetical protein